MNIHPNRTAQWVIGIFAAGLLCLVGFSLTTETASVYATPERQSTFLKMYKPDDAIESFLTPQHIIGGGHSEESESGMRAPKYVKRFEPRFVIRSEDRLKLTAALATNIAAAISDNGGQVSANTGDDVHGFSFGYVDGSSVGVVTMTPVVDMDSNGLDSVEGSSRGGKKNAAWRPGEILAKVTITINESSAQSQ